MAGTAIACSASVKQLTNVLTASTATANVDLSKYLERLTIVCTCHIAVLQSIGGEGRIPQPSIKIQFLMYC